MTTPEHLVTQLQDTTKAGLIVDLATLTLLLDRELVTPDEVIERIEALYNAIDPAQTLGVLVRLDAILSELRARPGARS